MDFAARGSGCDGSNKVSKVSSNKNYSSPTLVEFGPIQQISLGGTGSVVENAQMTNTMKHP